MIYFLVDVIPHGKRKGEVPNRRDASRHRDLKQVQVGPQKNAV